MTVLWSVIVLLAGLTCSGQALALSFSQAKEYLVKYGYLEKEAMSLQNLVSLHKAIEDFQKVARLTPTDLRNFTKFRRIRNRKRQLSRQTLSKMAEPRCGAKDRRFSASSLRGTSKWLKKDITYRIGKYPTGFSSLTNNQVNQEIAKALQVWADHIDIRFRAVDPLRDDRADINIRFEVGDHGDGSPFDGRGGTLAHAWPPRRGDTHFDGAEMWTLFSAGTNLFQVAVHEFGHALGLEHSNTWSTIMYPFYQYLDNFRLHSEDIQRIQRLYGSQRSAPSSSNRLCQDPTLDTIFTEIHSSRTYVIKGGQYWELGATGVATSAVPRDVQTKWPGLPARIDAAFSHPKIHKTYFFSGAFFWRYQDNRLDAGYPKPISTSFLGIPDNLDAAFVWPRNDQMYFFKGSQYWKLDYTVMTPTSVGYPREIGAWWRGVPDAPDAAFTRPDGRSYFVKAGSYAAIDDDAVAVNSVGFKRIGALFGCPGVKESTVRRLISTGSRKFVGLQKEALTKPDHNKCLRAHRCLPIP